MMWDFILKRYSEEEKFVQDVEKINKIVFNNVNLQTKKVMIWYKYHKTILKYRTDLN